MAEIEIENVSRVFPDGTEAVKDVSLDDRRRRVPHPPRSFGMRQVDAPADVAGLEDDQRGDLDWRRCHEREAAPRAQRRHGVSGLRPLPAHDRSRQHRFPLKLRRIPKDRAKAVIDAAAAKVELGTARPQAGTPLGRAAPAGRPRAVACAGPHGFLMDEPLSNLDAKLRVTMRAELKHLHRRAAHHHDLRDARPDRSDDARDRIAVMSEGVIQQLARK